VQPGSRPGPFRQRLRRDHSFFLELSFCNEAGIPHSFFLGGPLRWSQDDRAKAVAFLIEKATRCTMCGTAPWEWEANRYAYEPVIKLCRGCEIKESVSDQTDKRHGVSVELAPAAGPAAAQRRAEQERMSMRRAAMIAAQQAEEGKPITLPVTTPALS